MKWLLIFITLCTPVLAEDLPILPALGVPNWETNLLTDTSFPQTLEEQGSYASALLEWQRIAHKEQGQTRAQALLRIARLQHLLGRLQQAAATYTAFEKAFPAHKNLNEVMYWHSRTLPSHMRSKVLTKMAEKFPQNLWTKEATYRAVWDMTQEGYTIKNPVDPRAKELIHRLNSVFSDQKQQAFFAATWSLIPGAGYAFIKQWAKAGLTFSTIFLLMWTVFFALKHRHWPYATTWGMLLLGLWAYSALDVYKETTKNQHLLKLSAMAQWFDLHPLNPVKIKAQQTQEITH